MQSPDRSGTNLEFSRTRGSHRVLAGVLAAVVGCVVVGVGTDSVVAQSAAQSAQQASNNSLTTPWTVRFGQIQAAMEGKFGPYYTEQIRRVWDPATQSFEGTLEQLTFRPANPQSNTPYRFKLALVGIQGQTLSATQLRSRSAEFAKRAGLTFSFKSFRISDAKLAQQEYDLYFLARDVRRTQQGMNDVFRMVVYPKRDDRTAWLLELDVRTGYPLYSGEYIKRASGGFQLISELTVTSYETGVRVPSAKDPGWWAPFKAILPQSSGHAAIQMALTQSKKYAVPTASHLPKGFVLEKSEMHIDPFTGSRSALLSYTDGVDRVFLFQHNIPFVQRGADDVILVLEQNGMTQCTFYHHGVSFQMVGRSAGATIRGMSEDFYRHAISVLR